MIARYRLLARRIQLELEEIERTQAAIQKHWQTARRVAADQDVYLNSVALNLRSLYSSSVTASATSFRSTWTPTA